MNRQDAEWAAMMRRQQWKHLKNQWKKALKDPLWWIGLVSLIYLICLAVNR